MLPFFLLPTFLIQLFEIEKVPTNLSVKTPHKACDVIGALVRENKPNTFPVCKWFKGRLQVHDGSVGQFPRQVL